MSLGEQAGPEALNSGLIAPAWTKPTAAESSAYRLLVRLGRARKAIDACPRAELWPTLAASVRSLTDAAAVSVATVHDRDVDAIAAGADGATVGPVSLADRRAARSTRPGIYKVAATSGQVDLSDGGRTTSMINVPIDHAGRRIGTVTMLGRPGQGFTSSDTEATRQLVAGAMARLAEVRPARPAPGERRARPDQHDWQVWEWTGHGVVITGAKDKRVVRMTNSLSRTLGMTPNEAIGYEMDWGSYLVEYEDGTRCPEAELPPVTAATTGAAVAPRIYRIRGFPGVQWVRAAAWPVIDQDTGAAVEVYTWIENLTRSRLLNQRVEDADRRLEMASRVPGPIWWRYQAGTGSITVEPDANVVGLVPGDPLPSVEQLRAWVHPEDTDAVEQILKQTKPAPGESMSVVEPFTVRITPPDGRQRVLTVGATFTHDYLGNVVSCAGTAFDNTQLATARAELSISQDLVRRAFDLSPAALALVEISADHTGRILRANARLAELLGYPRERDLRGKMPIDYVCLEDLALFRAQVQAFAAATAGGSHRAIRLKTRQGAVLNAQLTGAFSAEEARRGLGADVPARAPYVLCHITAMHDGRASVDEVLASERLFQVTFDKSPVGMMLVTMAAGREGSIVTVNPALARMLQRSEDELLDRTPAFFMTIDDANATLSVLQDVALSGADSGPTQRQFLRADGEPLYCWFSAIVVDETTSGGPFLLCHVVDITAQRGQQQALERMALTDSLTRLPNRSLFTARMDQALARMEPGSHVALMVLDLDRFKNVNDGLGHHCGDLLLMEVAARLGTVNHPGVSVARQGGDEFTVLMERVADDYEVVALAEELLTLLTGDYPIGDGHIVSTSASIGVAIADSGERTREQLMREADLALYAAKAAGRNRFVLCDEELLAVAGQREVSEQRLRRALNADGLRVLLQPIVWLRSGRVQAMEALVRVYDPDVGLMDPDQMISVAEDAGLISELDRRVMDEAVRLTTVDPRLLDNPGARVNINVSGRTLEQPGLPRHLSEVLARHRVPGNRVAIELTESSLLADDPLVREAILGFRRLGAHIGIDDFGTGYSALAYLERFELDFLKIDRSFVARLGTEDQRSHATVAAIIALAHAHGLRVTAEGIETTQQRDLLHELGCDAGQGWLFGPATPS